jgi:hypothetical protein
MRKIRKIIRRVTTFVKNENENENENENHDENDICEIEIAEC